MARVYCRCGYVLYLSASSDEGEYRFMLTDKWKEIAQSVANKIMDTGVGDNTTRSLVEALKEEDDPTLGEALEEVVADNLKTLIHQHIRWALSDYDTFYKCSQCGRLIVFWDKAARAQFYRTEAKGQNK